MSHVNQKEIVTQKRVIQHFTQLGYRYLGDWHDRHNRNIEPEILVAWLKQRNPSYSDELIKQVIYHVEQAAVVGGSVSLYDANRAVYDLLRYGVKLQPAAHEQFITVWLIDWHNPSNNDFAVAEEVTVIGEHTKRPDVVLYVNGIALGVLELKRSRVWVSEGIRQNLDNQKQAFIRPFFATVQLVMAGNDSEGLRYGVIETKEKYYLTWQEASTQHHQLDASLEQICHPDRLLDIIHNFIVFDAGTKKTCRHNQYFGVCAAQAYLRRREGGIIWHTQGSGKSLTMVWLAKWIKEHITNSRVLIITDRSELDEQIERVFKGVSEQIYRTRSGSDLVSVLNTTTNWLMCSLIHKFGKSEEGDVDAFLQDVRRAIPAGFSAKGNIFVFVDECHRTQSGKLHHAMKSLLPNAVLLGFTGTPLLKTDKQTSIEVFGPYIHTYKYDEAVRDRVVLDLRYEARDIDQTLSSPAKIDAWFNAKTATLTDFAKAQLKARWGTMKKVLSSLDRLKRIVADIVFDMETQDRLMSGRGNALLVSESIYSACRFYELFQQTPLAGKCAIITSYKPTINDIKGEESGEGLTEQLLKHDIYRRMIANFFGIPEDKALSYVDEFEKKVKKRFIEDPAQLKLLIVVDKLLTGFDAPPATYLYIDKPMRDHGLFQAICRVNRLDDEKDYGYIVDYKDLFKSLERSIKDYTGEAFDGYDRDDVAGLLENRLYKARERLEELREAIKALCEPVAPPKDLEAYLRYFCGSPHDASASKATEPRRIALYKTTSSLLRAYADIATEMQAAGYSIQETQRIKDEIKHFESIRESVKLRSCDYIDMKMYEPAMRHLLDTYIQAHDSEKISAFDDMTLVQLLVERGESAIALLPEPLRTQPTAMAETIENNVRKLIIDEMAVNPHYYGQMSLLLDEIIQARHQEALDYRAYLAKIIQLATDLHQQIAQTPYPLSINTPILRVLYDNLQHRLKLPVQEVAPPYGDGVPENAVARFVIQLDNAIQEVKQAQWRENMMKQRKVRLAIKQVVGNDQALVNDIFALIVEQKYDY